MFPPGLLLLVPRPSAPSGPGPKLMSGMLGFGNSCKPGLVSALKIMVPVAIRLWCAILNNVSSFVLVLSWFWFLWLSSWSRVTVAWRELSRRFSLRPALAELTPRYVASLLRPRWAGLVDNLFAFAFSSASCT